MNDTIQDHINYGRNPNENLFVEVAMTVVFVAIIVFSAFVILGV